MYLLSNIKLGIKVGLFGTYIGGGVRVNWSSHDNVLSWSIAT